jgi:hypothetical protein
VGLDWRLRLTKANWVAVNTRATNEYSNCSHVIYLFERNLNPYIMRWLNTDSDDNDAFALADLIQFIWRSRIREGKPVIVYIASKRTIELLNNWIHHDNVMISDEGFIARELAA